MSQFMRILLSFILLGPPIGFLAFLGSLLVFEPIWTCSQTMWCFDFSNYALPQPPNGGKDFVLLVSVGLVLSYFVGGIPATLVGMASAIWNLKHDRLPFFVPACAGFFCAVAVCIYDFNLLYQNYGKSDVFYSPPYNGPLSAISEHEWQSFFATSFALLFACLVASWAGWRLALSKNWAQVER